MNNIERRKREKKRKGKLSNSEFSISKPKNMNFFPPFPSVNEFANLDNLSIDRGKKKKKENRDVSPVLTQFPCFPLMSPHCTRAELKSKSIGVIGDV